MTSKRYLYVKWNSIDWSDIEIYDTPQMGIEYERVPDRENPHSLVNQEAARGSSKTNYNVIEFDEKLQKHVYVVQYVTSVVDNYSYYSLSIEPSFDDLLKILENNYHQEHQYDEEECKLCKKCDGEARCLLRIQAKLAPRKWLEFGSDSLCYHITKIKSTDDSKKQAKFKKRKKQKMQH